MPSPALASHWRQEVLRTSLWFVPAIEVITAIGLFALTTVLDKAAYRGEFTVPSWVISGKHQDLVRLAAGADVVICLEHRPGHFLVRGQRFATVWPGDAAARVRQRLGRAHIIGPHRTLTQDVSFGIDQLAEIAIRALSPAVNDTFTALTCIDWPGENLCKIVTRWHPSRVHRDEHGHIRVISAEPSYDRLVQRAFEKIRQSSQGMPAVMIRQLEALARVMAETASDGQRRVLLEQSAMIDRASERSVPEAADRADVRRRYEALLTAETRLAGTQLPA